MAATNPYQSPIEDPSPVAECASRRRHVAWTVRLTGALHLVGLVIAGSLVPDQFSWGTYLIIVPFWFPLILASYDLIRGRRWAMETLVVVHCLLLAAALCCVGYALKEIWIPTPAYDDGHLSAEFGRELAIALILPVSLGLLLVTALTLSWTVRLRSRYFASNRAESTGKATELPGA